MPTNNAELKARIARARKAIAYVDRCEKEAVAMGFPPETLAKIRASAEEVRQPAKALLRILLAELEAIK